jgi:hypothetical protein
MATQTEPTTYALTATWRWAATLHLFAPNGTTTRCGRPAVAQVAASTVQQVLGSQRPVCGTCERAS